MTQRPASLATHRVRGTDDHCVTDGEVRYAPLKSLWLLGMASAAIVGGRNLGDEYFDAEPNLNFTDIDMLGVGPVAEQLGHSFDQYWNSALSKPIDDFLSSKPTAKDLQNTRAWISGAAS